MRDGVTLATDVYLPASGGRVPSKPLPALMQRTPYNKGGGKSGMGMLLARHGYLVAVQDARGRYASDGEFNAFAQEAEDGYDAIEWLASQPECDGRVGTFGGSYEAYAQAAAVTQSPPHLAAVCHYFGYPHGYHSVRQGGALDIFWMSYFAMMAGDGKEAQANPAIRKALTEMRFEEWLSRWPIREGQSPLALAPSYEKTFFNYLRHECLDDFWRQPGLSPAEYLDRWPDVPTLWVCGWFDHYPYAHPDTLAFSRLARLGHRHQYVVFGPWTHGEVGREIGQTTFGRESEKGVVLPDYELRWFDRWLKGIEDDGIFASHAKYFTMGGGAGTKTHDGLLEHGGRWQEAEAWPPADTDCQSWYFKAGGGLCPGAPQAAESSTTYRSDPGDPAPSSTGVCYTVTRLKEGGSRRINTNGAWDQVEGRHLWGVEPPYLPLASRSDLLVSQTAPLDEDLEVTGHPVVELWVSTDAVDADFVAKLIDVYPPSRDFPHGFALAVAEGIQRAKFRNGFEKPELLTPGRPHLIRIDLRPLSNLFLKGHRLRVDVTSSSFPHFDVNTHTGRNPSEDYERRIAHHAIHHEKGCPSRILLPVIPREEASTGNSSQNSQPKGGTP
jgi:putative CocE/NonD family hydrolase